MASRNGRSPEGNTFRIWGTFESQLAIYLQETVEAAKVTFHKSFPCSEMATVNSDLHNDPAVDSIGTSDWALPLIARTIELGKTRARLWICFQVAFGVVALPIATIFAMETLINWGVVGHGDNFVDVDRISIATLAFYGLAATGPLIASCIPLPACYSSGGRMVLRCLLFGGAVVLFWPVLFLVQIIVMVCWGSGFS